MLDNLLDLQEKLMEADNIGIPFKKYFSILMFPLCASTFTIFIYDVAADKIIILLNTMMFA